MRLAVGGYLGCESKMEFLQSPSLGLSLPATKFRKNLARFFRLRQFLSN